MTRRKFVTLAGSAIAAAGIPLAVRVARAEERRSSEYGGPIPNSDFYVTTYGDTPRVDVNAWRLRISGLVKQPIELDYSAIRKLPPINETLTLECIGNPPNGSIIGNAAWVGTKLRPLLDRAQPRADAVYVKMRAADGYATGMPLDDIMREENFLPYLMNGQPLPAEHGFPLRIFIPGKYGMKQPKWITEIEFVDKEFVGYWEARGWSKSGWRKVNSGFFYPPQPGWLSNPAVKTPCDIVGWALAGPSGIRRVEASTDSGTTWHNAEIVRNSSRYIWTVWKYRFAPSAAGSYIIAARATAGDGSVQGLPNAREGLEGHTAIARELVEAAPG